MEDDQEVGSAGALSFHETLSRHGIQDTEEEAPSPLDDHSANSQFSNESSGARRYSTTRGASSFAARLEGFVDPLANEAGRAPVRAALGPYDGSEFSEASGGSGHTR